MTKINNFTFGVIVFLCLFVPLREIIALYTFDFIKFLPDLIIWSFAAFIIVKNKFKLNFKLYDWAFAAFIIVGLVATLINGSSLLAFALQTRSISTMYVFFYILRNTELQLKQFSVFANLLMLVLSALILFAFIEHFSDKLLLFPYLWRSSIKYASNYARVYSLMNNPNSFAFFSYMVMAFVYFVNKNKHKKIHYIFYTAVFFAIFLTASRSTFLAVIIFFGFLTFDSIKAKNFKPLIKMTAAISVAAVLLVTSNLTKTAIYDNFDVYSFLGVSGDSENDRLSYKEQKNGIAFLDRFNELGSDQIYESSTSDGRIYVILTGLKIFADHPFGTGFGTYGSAGSQMITPDLYKEYGINPNLYSDNEYIKVFVETGILGTLIYIAFILLLFKSCLKSKPKLITLISFLFIGMFYNVFEMQTICFVMYLILNFADRTAKNNLSEIKHTVE